MRALVYLTFFTILSGNIYSQNEAELIDAYIQEVIQEWNIPGVAIAIVKDGEQVLAEGYGVKDASKKDAVDP